MIKRMINAKEKTIMEMIMEYSHAVHTDQPELFTYFNPEEIHTLGFFTYGSFAEKHARGVFEWAHRNYGDDIPEIRPDDWNIKNLSPRDKKTLLELMDECIEWLDIEVGNKKVA